MNPRMQRSYRSACLLTGLVMAVVSAMAPSYAVSDDSRAALRGLGDAFAEISEVAAPAVVFISVEKKMGHRRTPQGHPDIFEYFFGPQGPRGQQGPRGPQQRPRQMPRPQAPREEDSTQLVPFGQGSGFLISSDGYILTNHHVVGDADKVLVLLKDGREFEATIIGSDKRTEIAVIKIEANNLPTLEFGDSEALRIGEWVLAIGNPFGLEHSVTAGIVSAKGRGIGIMDYSDFIQTDAAINPGNSGGPLLDLDGKVVGMNTALYSRSGGYMGIGFAIPVNMIGYVKDQLMTSGKVARGFIGVRLQPLSPDMARHFGVARGRGVIIPEVIDGMPGKEAGLQAGDIVVEFNGQPVQEPASFSSRVASTPPGTKISLVIIRDGKRMAKDIVLGTLPDDMDGRGADKEEEGRRSHQDLGFSVQDLEADLAEQLGYAPDTTGVVINEVRRGSRADRAGLRQGDIITMAKSKPVANVEEFEAALEEAQEEDSILLMVRDPESSRYVVLKFDN
jgi:serine protease Do